MAKNLSTKSRRSVNEVSAKDFSSPAKFFFAEKLRLQRIFYLILIFSAKTHFFRNFLRLVAMLSQKILKLNKNYFVDEVSAKKNFAGEEKSFAETLSTIR